MIHTRSTTGTVCRPTLIFGELPSIRNEAFVQFVDTLSTLPNDFRNQHHDQRTVVNRRRAHNHLLSIAQVKGSLHSTANSLSSDCKGEVLYLNCLTTRRTRHK